MSHYTPGPWQTYGAGGVEPCGAPRYELNDGWIIADCPGPDGKANAALIAVCPDMLEILIKLTRKTHEMVKIQRAGIGGNEEGAWGELHNITKDAQSLIARVTRLD